MANNGISFNFDTEGLEETRKNIKDMLNRLQNPENGFKVIANYMRSKVIDHFRNEQGKTAKWKELSPVTIALRLHANGKDKEGKKISNVDILRDTGNLYNSIQGNSAESITRITKTYVEIGTTTFYAVYHEQPDNSGGTNSYSGKKIIPKRDFMYLSNQEIEDMKTILENAIFGKAK